MTNYETFLIWILNSAVDKLPLIQRYLIQERYAGENNTTIEIFWNTDEFVGVPYNAFFGRGGWWSLFLLGVMEGSGGQPIELKS